MGVLFSITIEIPRAMKCRVR